MVINTPCLSHKRICALANKVGLSPNKFIAEYPYYTLRGAGAGRTRVVRERSLLLRWNLRNAPDLQLEELINEVINDDKIHAGRWNVGSLEYGSTLYRFKLRKPREEYVADFSIQ